MALYIGTNTRNASLIARFGVSTELIKRLLDKYVRPRVGDLRFQSSVSPDTTLVRGTDGIYMPTSDFDGWAYPRSSIVLNRSVFPEAFELYGEPGRSTFSLPNITDLPLKMVGSLGSIGLTIRDKRVYVPTHKHKLGTITSANITLTNGLSYISSGGNSSSPNDDDYYSTQPIDGVNVKLPRFHHGQYNEANDRPVPLDINMEIADGKFLFGEDAVTTDVGTSDAEGNFTLDNLTMPIMLYIGKPHLNSSGPYTVNFFTDKTN